MALWAMLLLLLAQPGLALVAHSGVERGCGSATAACCCAPPASTPAPAASPRRCCAEEVAPEPAEEARQGCDCKVAPAPREHDPLALAEVARSGTARLLLDVELAARAVCPFGADAAANDPHVELARPGVPGSRRDGGDSPSARLRARRGVQGLLAEHGSRLL